MTEFRTVRHGGDGLDPRDRPWRGYMSSVTKQHVPLDFAGPDSRDVLYYSTSNGKWGDRAGSSILGDTFTTDSVTGLLPSKYVARARQIVEEIGRASCRERV